MKTNIGIIGSGRLGLSFASALQSHYSIVWLCNKSGNPVNGYFVEQFETLSSTQFFQADIIAICSTDKELTNVIATIKNKYGSLIKGKCFFHCSGATPISILDPLLEYGAYIAAIHPYQTFPYPDKKLITAIPWLVECDDETIKILEPFLTFLKANIYRSPRFLTTEEKLLWHSTAVFSSNFTATLYQIAASVMSSLGIEQSNEFIGSIAKQTIENVTTSLLSTGQIEMSGPIVRGDIEIIQAETDALNSVHPLYSSVYAVLSEATKLLLQEIQNNSSNE